MEKDYTKSDCKSKPKWSNNSDLYHWKPQKQQLLSRWYFQGWTGSKWQEAIEWKQICLLSRRLVPVS